MKWLSLIILTFIFSFISHTCIAQEVKQYESEWKRIDELIQKRALPKTALEEVQKLYATAKKEKQEAQVIKALVYITGLQQQNREGGELSSIKELEKELPLHKAPAAAILKSLLADMYWQYYQRHRWQLYNRTATANFIKEDIATWGIDDFVAKITALFLESLHNETILKNTKLQYYDAIILKGNTRHLRPTLYDLLAHRALQYFISGESELKKPAYAFNIKSPDALAPAAQFVKASFPTQDTLSLQHKALLLYQALVQFHLNDKDPSALLDVDISRLAYAYRHATTETKEILYTNSLQNIIDTYGTRGAAAYASYLLALYYEDLANRYNPLSDTTYRYARLKAKALLEPVVKDSAVKSYGWAASYNLLKAVQQPQFSFEVEKVNIPAQPFRTLIKYKNVPQLYFRVIKVTESLQATLRNGYNDKYWHALVAAAPVNGWQQHLPATNDLQLHHVEAKIDALPVGEYLLLAATDPLFSTNTALAAHRFYVSGISYIGQKGQYFVLDRQSGRPLANAAVQVYEQQYNYNSSRYSRKAWKDFKTDKNGFFNIGAAGKEKHQTLFFDITHKTDRLNLEDGFYHYYYTNSNEENNEDKRKKIFFFTDRAIYRPGQTVHFKGIVIKAFKEQSTIVANHAAKLFLENANGEDVDSIQLTSNAFGSFSGKFILPQNVLNGSFKIYEDEDDNAVTFSVEDYKRPKFHVAFEPPKGVYKVGDSIRVIGNAQAYAGNVINGAKVSYRVVRQPRFLYPWLFRRGWFPHTQGMEITQGETVTNNNGQFSITFKAVPDETIKQEWDPLFDYRLYADVTDAAGETRSSEQTVTAGYKSLLLKVNVADKVESDSLKTLSIQTQNMAGTFQPSLVTVAISKLVPEQRLIRERLWQQPDQFVFSKEQYIQYFPNDEYRDEKDYRTWAKGATIYHKTDSTKANGMWQLKDAVFTTGIYEVVISTTDKEGRLIKDMRFIEVTDTRQPTLAVPAYLWAKGLQQALEPGTKARVQLATAAQEVYLIQNLDKQAGQNQMLSFSFASLQNEKKTFEYSIAESDRGGFGISYFFVKHNRLHQHHELVNVPWSNKALHISYATFRDKTLPGAEEQWKVNISGYKNEQVAAEMLASMYDASLDQFVPHNWQKPAIWSIYYMQHPLWNSTQNFTAVTSQQKWVSTNDYKNIHKQYDQLLQPYNMVQNIQTRYRQAESIRSNRLADSVMAQAPAVDNLEEVVVTGYGNQRKANMTSAVSGNAAGVQIRGAASIEDGTVALIIVDGVPVASASNINPADILSTIILKGEEAVALYGARAANGVLVITTKKGATKGNEELQVRKNLAETAFFFPHLQTDKDGNISFSFTAPEALTRWKLQTLAHTKNLAMGVSAKEIVTQKQLMVQPNMPRFLRQGDRIEISVKIANLSAKELTGQAQLLLMDATTGQSVDGWFQNIFPNQYFTVAAGSSEVVLFPIEVPYLFNGALTWRVVARAENFSDGEEASLPVLTNKLLVTETLPLPVQGTGTKKFTFQKLANAGSETLQHHALTVEYTANPAWYAVQALPYLMEYPFDCAEQVWNRYYANALASSLISKAPRIKAVFENWKSKDTAALVSNLQKNEELKALLLQETPWVLQAKTEKEQKQNLALLFDMMRMNKELKGALEKLRSAQSNNGGFVWFKGGPDDRYITQYILTGIGHLKHLKSISQNGEEDIASILKTAIPYLDKKLKEDYDYLLKNKADVKQQQVSYLQIQYLYMRSFFTDVAIAPSVQTAYNYYRKQAQQHWTKMNRYMQGMTALALHRTADLQTPKDILASLKETAIYNEELGMYWKDVTYGYSPYWWSAPVETQALLIEAFTEVGRDAKTVDALKTWLLKNKQTTNWRTTKATAEACYALLLSGTDWLSNSSAVQIQLGNTTISNKDSEMGTGYFKQTIAGTFVNPQMSAINVTVQQQAPTASTAPSWGAVYWQYFEDLDKITTAATPLQLSKKLFVEKAGDRGPVLTPVVEGAALKVGDKIKVRIELRADRDMEYVHMKDMRASALEPQNVLSGYKWQGGLGYYETTRDAGTHFFFNYLRKGTYVFEYPLFITHTGNFSNGVTTIQSMYAPEFAAHSEGIRITVEQ